MRSVSMKRTRASSMSMPKRSYSYFAVPRPKPRWIGASVNRRSCAIEPASLSALYQGAISTQVPSPASGKRPAMWDRKARGSGVGK